MRKRDLEEQEQRLAQRLAEEHDEYERRWRNFESLSTLLIDALVTASDCETAAGNAIEAGASSSNDDWREGDIPRTLINGPRSLIESYFIHILRLSPYPESLPHRAEVAYVPESKQLLVDFTLPTLDAMPADFISVMPRKIQKQFYASVVAQVALRTVHEVFVADHMRWVDTVIFNGSVDTIDRATGHPVRPCLVTLRTTRDVFMGLNLREVDPIACLKGLKVLVSNSPAELVPVRPILEFNMVDPRFVQEADVLSVSISGRT